MKRSSIFQFLPMVLLTNIRVLKGREMIKKISRLLATFSVLCWAGLASADPISDAIVELQHDWAKGYYSTPAKQQENYFEALHTKAHQVT